MKLTAKIKLQPTPDQHATLLQTLETANAACNDISQQAWEVETFQQYPLHHLVYYDIRKRYGLSAQMAVRAIAKVADAYKLDRKTQRTFQSRGAFPYDNRILSFKSAEQTVSIWTLEGRQHMPYLCGERQCELLDGTRGEADLCYIGGEFYLFVACEVETPEPGDVDGYLGVDLGIVNLAADSDGETYSGAQIEDDRRKHQHRRRNLQRKGTRSAKRKQRARHANWAFYQLRQFIEYKAALAGVAVVAVDPRNTSRTCPTCGCVDKHNRPDQATFLCVHCGHSAPADTNAAVNIAARAVSTGQTVLRTKVSASLPGTNFPL